MAGEGFSEEVSSELNPSDTTSEGLGTCGQNIPGSQENSRCKVPEVGMLLAWRFRKQGGEKKGVNRKASGPDHRGLAGLLGDT